MVEQFENYVKLNKKVPPEALASIPQITDPGELADRIASHLAVKITDASSFWRSSTSSSAWRRSTP